MSLVRVRVFKQISKAVTKKEGPKDFLDAPKIVSFSQLPAVKKDIIFGAAKGQLISKVNFKVFYT